MGRILPENTSPDARDSKTIRQEKRRQRWSRIKGKLGEVAGMLLDGMGKADPEYWRRPHDPR